MTIPDCQSDDRRRMRFIGKLGDIPSMFAEVIPNLEVGETAKIQSGSGFHLVYLADERGRKRMVQQTEVRHILIKPTEVLDPDDPDFLILHCRL